MEIPRPAQPEALILANGPSLLGRPWDSVPRDRVYIVGVNQSWRAVPDADAHVAVDREQFHMEGGRPYYEAHAARGTLFHTGGGESLRFALNRNDRPVFGRRPFAKKHRGAKPSPPPHEDGGVTLKIPNESGGSTAYVALQIVAALPFGRIWIVGLDGQPDPKAIPVKFTGEKSNCQSHGRLWKHVPRDVRDRLTVIEPSQTAAAAGLRTAPWPWVAQEAAA